MLMRLKFRKGIIGFLFIPLVIALDLVYYYLDDVLDHGHALTYLNSYGQGWLTWWWDFQWFWGYLELGTIKACLIAAWLLYYSPPGVQTRTTPRKSPWIWALVSLLVVAFIFSTSSPNNPVTYNAGAILLWGWDPAFAARHLLEILLFASGFWILPILILLRRRGASIRRWNASTGLLLCVSAAFTTHLVLVGAWQADEVLVIDNMVFGALGSLLVILPVTFASLSLFMKAPSPTLSGEIKRPKSGVKWQDLVFWPLLLCSFFGIILGVFWNPLNKSLDFGSQWVPYNFWSWIYVALLATTIIQIVWRRTGSVPAVSMRVNSGGVTG